MFLGVVPCIENFRIVKNKKKTKIKRSEILRWKTTTLPKSEIIGEKPQQPQKSEILRWKNHTNPETLSPAGSHPEVLAVLGLPKILGALEGSEQIFPRRRSLGAPDSAASEPQPQGMPRCGEWSRKK